MADTNNGQSDWRLPDVDDLLSLVDYTKAAPMRNTTIFPDSSKRSWYGSSSRLPETLSTTIFADSPTRLYYSSPTSNTYDYSAYAWGVNLVNGYLRAPRQRLLER